jgi:hypothetical protein
MKKLTILLFSILISFNSYSEWTRVTQNKGDSSQFYIDIDTVKEHKGYVYYWALGDTIKPIQGTLSATFYNELDCGVKRQRTLSIVTYKESMGEQEGRERVYDSPEWEYPQPGRINYAVMNYVCNHIK